MIWDSIFSFFYLIMNRGSATQIINEVWKFKFDCSTSIPSICLIQQICIFSSKWNLFIPNIDTYWGYRYTDVCFRKQRFLQRARLYTILPFGKAGRDKNEYFTANKLQRLFIWHLFCIGKISNVLMWKVWFKRLQRKGTITQQICWEWVYIMKLT